MKNEETHIDCLKMKEEIRDRLAQEWEGLSIDEIADRLEAGVKASDDPFIRYWVEVASEPPVHRLRGENSEGKQ